MNAPAALLHYVDLARFRVPLAHPLRCPACSRTWRAVSRTQAALLGKGFRPRCPRHPARCLVRIPPEPLR